MSLVGFTAILNYSCVWVYSHMSHLHSSDNFRYCMQCDLHITEQEFTFSLINSELNEVCKSMKGACMAGVI
jgi:hypothetical protein